MSNRLKIKENKMEIKIDQEKVLDDVINKINFEMIDEFLVKPLETPMIMKHITELVPVEPKEIDEETGFPKMETKEYDKEVESAFRKGIVLKVPFSYKDGLVEVGDTIVFPYKFSKDFDLFKDSMIVKKHDVIALVKRS